MLGLVRIRSCSVWDRPQRRPPTHIGPYTVLISTDDGIKVMYVNKLTGLVYIDTITPSKASGAHARCGVDGKGACSGGRVAHSRGRATAMRQCARVAPRGSQRGGQPVAGPNTPARPPSHARRRDDGRPPHRAGCHGTAAVLTNPRHHGMYVPPGSRNLRS